VKTKIWISLAFLVTFIFGLTTGYLIPRKPFNTPRNAWMQDRDMGRLDPFERQVEARKRLMKVLDLNEEQQADFEEASSKFQRDVRGTLLDSNLETRERIRQHNDLLDKEMRGILNDQQYLRWQKIHQRRMELLQNQGERWRSGRRLSD
jgi:hypothetical protein